MKTFKFIYEDTEYDGPGDNWPVQSLIEAEHLFHDETTWPNVLRQFAKFLESTGYDDVVRRIRVEDKYGINGDCGFETYNDVEHDEADEYIMSVLDNEDKDAQ